MLLKAEDLNCLGGLIAGSMDASSYHWSSGILSGMDVTVEGEGLSVDRGSFKIGAQVGWLGERVLIPKPEEKGSWNLLLSQTDRSGDFELGWNPSDIAQSSGTVVLCRLSVTGLRLRDHWIYGGTCPETVEDGLLKFPSDTVLAQYSQHSSRGNHPSLSPKIQRKLAGMVDLSGIPSYFALGLLTGSLPICDVTGSQNWDQALRSLSSALTGRPRVEEASPVASRSHREAERNLAG